MLGWQQDNGLCCFLWQDKLWRRPVELANIQLQFFIDKMNKLKIRLNEQRTVAGRNDPLWRLEVALHRWSGRKNVPVFTFQKVTVGEIFKLVKTLGKSQSFGHDGIDSNILKLILPSIVAPLTHLVNVSLSTGTWAGRWKVSRVFPLLKDTDADRLAPSSYRPVSLLPSISKIVERAAQIQLLKCFESTGQLNNSAHAYRKNLSTSTTLASIVDELYCAAEDRRIAQMMTVDQSMAFDCINHSILIRKLKLYGLGEVALKWTENYLSMRSQYITVGGANSAMRSIGIGVPQGSVMGSLYYAIYVNDMTEVTRNKNCTEPCHQKLEKLFGETCAKCGVLNLYADDATLVVSNKKREQNSEKMKDTLREIRKFLNENDLHLNIGKTATLECMLPQKRGRTPGLPPQLVVEEEPGVWKEIVDTGQMRILGVNIQANMSWTEHLDFGKKALLPHVRKQLGALVHLGKKVPLNCRRTLATGLILSRIQYVISIWGTGTENQIRRAQVVQNKAARWCMGLKRKTKIGDLMTAVGWLTIREMATMQGAILIWKMLHADRPRHLRDKLEVGDNMKIQMTEPRLKFTKRSFLWKSSNTWNLLTDEMRTRTTLAVFKKEMRDWIIKRRCREPA